MQSTIEEELRPTDIKLLHGLRELDTRTYNLCKTNGFNDLDDLTEYYLEHGTFKQLRNCGVISNHVLINLCKRHAQKEENILYLEENALEFHRYELAKSALKSGFIDALVLLKPSGSVRRGNKIIKGKLGICASNNI